jgi:DNA-directed RNA polymerase specialized sigma subunit
MPRWCATCRVAHRCCAICHASHATTQLCDTCRKDPANRDWIEQDEAVALEHLDNASRLDAVPDPCLPGDATGPTFTLRIRTLADLQDQRPIREIGQREQQILVLAHSGRVKVKGRRYRAPRQREIAEAVGCSQQYVSEVIKKILK